MKTKVEFNFKFKGQRTYVHGTDIYNTITSYLIENGIEPETTDMSIHKVTSKQMDAIISDDAADELPDGYSVRYNFSSNEKKYRVYLYENDSELTERYDYPEETIVEKSTIDGDTITLNENSGFSNIENIVALNKGILEEKFKAETGKWYFVRLKLEKSILKPNPQTTIVKTEKTRNLKLTKSSITFDGEQQGSIFFSLV